MAIKKTPGERLFAVVNSTLMVLLVLVTLYPFWYIVIYSFNVGTDARSGGLTFLVRQPTWENYSVILGDKQITNGFFISTARTLIGTVTSVFCTALFSYAISRKKLLGRKFITALLTFTMFFSAGIIPVYLLMRDLHLLNNFLVYIIPGLLSAFMVIITRTYYEASIPPSVEESAMMDGASDLKIFFGIILPVSAPILATVALFVGVGNWNDWFAGYIYMTKPDLVPLQTVMVQIINQAAASAMMASERGFSSGIVTGVTIESVRAATMVVAIVPIVLVYPFLQRYFVKGILVGAIKE